MKSTIFFAPVIAALIGAAPAATIIPVDSVTGHHQGDTFDGSGSMLTIINGENNETRNGLDLQGQAEYPPVWTHTNSWQTDWQGDQLSNATNGKLGWAVFDFGSEQTALGMMYLWNVNENNRSGRGTQEFNIYYATSPTVPLPERSDTPTDYDFSSGGWTKLNLSSLWTLIQGDETTENVLDGSYDISGISSARYIGLELMSDYGRTDRIGLGEVVFTEVPEPTSAATLLGLVGMGLFLRRRR